MFILNGDRLKNFVKLTVLNVKLKLHPRTKVRATKLQEMSAGHTTMGERLKSAVGFCYKCGYSYLAVA